MKGLDAADAQATRRCLLVMLDNLARDERLTTNGLGSEEV